jgi:tetratricopeptide (TPR) repeat protein
VARFNQALPYGAAAVQLGQTMTKRKDERRELLKEDEFLSILERCARFVQQNTKQVAIYAVVVLAVLAIFFWWMSHRQQQRQDRAEVLYKAEKILDTPLEDENADHYFETAQARYEAALVELDKIIAEESGLLKHQAIVHKIGCLIDMGRQEETIPLYEELIQNGKSLAYLGLMGMADMYRAKGDYDQARVYYNRVLDAGRGTPDLEGFVQFRTAQTYQDAGDLENAKRELDALIGKFEGVEDLAQQPPILQRARQLRDEIEAELPDGEEAADEDTAS